MVVRNDGDAMELVRDNLGLTADDLGMDRESPFEGLEFDDDGNESNDDNDIHAGDDNTGFGSDDPSQQQAPDASEQEYNDLRVTHTPNQQQQQRQQQRPFPAATGLTTDKKGNIVNDKGKIVAYAGRESRLFVDNHKLRNQVSTVQNQANLAVRETRANLEKAVNIGQQLLGQLNELRSQPNLEKEFNISNQELRFAADLARSAKTDPIGTLKTLLTKAATSGIDLTQLGLQPGGFDSAALMKMVRETIADGVKPVQQMTEQQRVAAEAQQQREQGQAAVNQELNTFLSENPEARGYLPVFKQVYEQPHLAHMSLGEVWSRVQLNLLRRGIDVKNPQQQQRAPNRQQAPRLPNGRGNPPGGGQGRQQPSELAPVSSSYEDIVRGVMAGLV